ncbi:MAG: hypothetical protein JNM24_04590 [Bdellovibrionaceae bacterium]|nr:hypothetical protein [Pseudobdellovibrionaceae bacterium]
MKTLIYLSIFISFIASANNALHATFITHAKQPNLSAVKINWSNPANKKASMYRSTFEAELAMAKNGQKHLLDQRYVMINPGCGSECQVIGYFDVITGNAYISEVSSLYEIAYRANSTLLVVNPPESIEAVFGNERHPSYVKTEYYQIKTDGTMVPVQ